MNAAWKGQLETVKYLLSKGTAINETTNLGKSALYFAAKYDHLEVVQYLVKQRADLSSKTNADKGKTPLDHTEKGAYSSIEDKLGQTPLDIAREYKHDDVVKFLEAKIKAMST